MNYTDKLHRLQERRNPGMIFDSSYENFAERLQKSSSFTEREKAIEYALDSMKQLPKRSTEISYEEGERVKGHLKEELLCCVSCQDKKQKRFSAINQLYYSWMMNIIHSVRSMDSPKFFMSKIWHNNSHCRQLAPSKITILVVCFFILIKDFAC